MASNAELREHFQVALSYREKAQRLQQESARAWSAGKIDNAAYETVSRFYADHLRLAEKDIARWREEIAARNDQLRTEQNQLVRDAERLRQEEAIGRIVPERASKERGRLEREIAWHGAAIAELQQLAGAQSSESVGGHVDLPLDAYRGERGAAVPERRRGWRWTWEAAVLVLALVLVGFAVILALPLLSDSDWSLWGNTPAVLRCGFSMDTEQEKSVQVDCRNEGDRPIHLYQPWPDARPPDGELSERSLGGIEVQLRERGDDAFQTYPVPSEWWTHNGRPLNAGEPVVIEPLLTARLVLDTTMVKSIGQGMDAVRLIVKRGDGEVFDTYETVFSEARGIGVTEGATRPAGPPATPRVSTRPRPESPGERTVPSPRPAEAPVAPARPAVEPDAPAARETEPEEVPSPQVYAHVSFLGRVGGKVALSIRRPVDERARRTTVEAGDDIGGGWLVDELERDAEQAVVLIHPATGRRVRVPQGAGEPVALTEPEQ